MWRRRKDNLNFMPSMKLIDGCEERVSRDYQADVVGKQGGCSGTFYDSRVEVIGKCAAVVVQRSGCWEGEGEVYGGEWKTDSFIGAKTTKGKQILLEDLMSEDYLDLDQDA
jgi:hypothetical protein